MQTITMIDTLHDDVLSALAVWTTEQAVTIQQIAAPTFAEAERAAFVCAEMQQLGLKHVETDALHNVYGMIAGASPGSPVLLIVAHTDTVFSAATDLTTRRDGHLIYGPGLGDNSVGVAGMLAFARFLHDEQIVPACDVWCIATSREEGLGDLGGMKAAYARFADRLGEVINLEGLAYGHVYNGGIAVRRLCISAHADGGHSWLHFGRPSAVHGLTMLGAKICSLQPPAAPRATYNIGMIEGGTAINAIATEARLWLDLRSETMSGVEALEKQVRGHVKALSTDGLTFKIEIVGDRPSGAVPQTHPLVQDALAVLRQLGVEGTLETGSTDANIPLSHGCPAVTIGITRGGNAHRTDEYIETEPIADGLKLLISLSLTTATRIAGVSS
ncbi:MAG: M20/M25/M40 family metallo-hydrolase [Chloroflexota bacterium]|nr:M20/M25/M40 family metallo-hydrolase [Chloroflexota bacterium]